ncbi:MAG: hypothetical protein RLY14_1741, partial [Planctomycetota bacterium]
SNATETTSRDGAISPTSNSYAAGFHTNVEAEDEAIIHHVDNEVSSFDHTSYSNHQEYPPSNEALEDHSNFESVVVEDFNASSNLPFWSTNTSDSDTSDSVQPSTFRYQNTDDSDQITDSTLSDTEGSNSGIVSDSWGDGLEEDIFSDASDGSFSDGQRYGSNTDEIEKHTSFPSISALDILRASYAQSSDSEEDESYHSTPPSGRPLNSRQQDGNLDSSLLEAMRSSKPGKSSVEQESTTLSPQEDEPANSASALLERLKREMIEEEEQEQAAIAPANSMNSLRSPKDKSLDSTLQNSYVVSSPKPAQQHSSHTPSSHGHSGGAADHEEPGAEDDSVEAYMQKLLARMRGDSQEESKEATSSPVSPKTTSTKSSIGKSTSSTNKVVRTTYSPMRKSRQDPAAALIASRPQVDAATEGNAVAEGVVDPNATPEDQEGEAVDYSTPRTAPEKTTDFQALRELANDSARTAIKSSESKIRPVGNIIKMSISVLASLFGIQLLYENGLQVNLTLVAAATAFMLAAIWCMDVIQNVKAAKNSEKKNGPGSQVQMKISGKR